MRNLFFKGSIIASIKRIRKEAAEAPILENESLEDQDKGYRFEYHEGGKGEQGNWRLRAGNHEIMIIGEGYKSESGIEHILENIRKEMGCAEITWENPEDNPTYQERHDDRTETKGIPGS